MPNEKRFFHDRIVLLLLSISTFLSLLGSVLVLLRVDSRSSGYIVQYRANLGISAFQTGKLTDLLAFIVFLWMALIINTILAMRIYHMHRWLALTIVSLGLLLLIIAIIVSNALLVLR